MESRFSDLKAPILAGTVASITGQAASTGVVIAATTALGATPTQIVSLVFVMLLLYGSLSILLSWRYKMPISIVWSTPGAALLVSAGGLNYGYATATWQTGEFDSKANRERDVGGCNFFILHRTVQGGWRVSVDYAAGDFALASAL
jgi:hypothetical protein